MMPFIATHYAWYRYSSRSVSSFVLLDHLNISLSARLFELSPLRSNNQILFPPLHYSNIFFSASVFKISSLRSSIRIFLSSLEYSNHPPTAQVFKVSSFNLSIQIIVLPLDSSSAQLSKPSSLRSIIQTLFLRSIIQIILPLPKYSNHLPFSNCPSARYEAARFRSSKSRS